VPVVSVNYVFALMKR